MSLSFDKSTFASIDAIPVNLQSQELYPKVTGMVDFIIKNYAREFEDVKLKFRGPDLVSQDVIKNIITELGFKYIADVMDTISNFEFNTLLEFVSLINLLKGSRTGVELILKLLGFDSIIREWWEQDPVHPVYTFEVVVIMDSNKVPDAVATLAKVKVFARAYVFPIIENIDFRFSISIGARNLTPAGFFKPHYSTSAVIQIMRRLP